MKFYTRKEVAEILRVSDTTVFRILYEGQLGAMKVGRQWRISQNELDSYIKRHTVKGRGY